jgi:DNA uptake protein ComE-like DNA-binding protein
MKRFKSPFYFTRSERRGIVVLVSILVPLIGVLYYVETLPSDPIEIQDTSIYQAKIDSLKLVQQRTRDTIYPFNPNYITDYRGYKLGLTVEELDRLFRFRESGKFINSPQEFKQVTQVSQQWLDSISPYFKFPEWVTNPKKSRYRKSGFSNKPKAPTDINTATAEQLREVYGIGPALSVRIIKERERLGEFIDMSQVAVIYGLTDSTMVRVKERFFIEPLADFKKIPLNEATRDELLSIPYFNDYLVDELIKQRTLRDGFKSWDKVVLTSRFPEEKLPLIQLYLTLD